MQAGRAGTSVTFIENLRWISPASWRDESGDSPQANRFTVHTGYMGSVRDKPPLNVGDKLRRYERVDVASHLVCDVSPDAAKR